MTWHTTRAGFGGILIGAALALIPPSADAMDQSESCPESKKPVAENDPLTCHPIWSGIGLPVSPADAGICITTVCHFGYIVGHNDRLKVPEWVIEHLTPEIVSGPNKRPKRGFNSEPNVPVPAVDREYKDSDFDRGHQAPSGDFTISKETMVDTFYLSNVVPQVGPGFNQGIWKRLEFLTQDLARNRDEIYVVTGPIHRQKGAVVRAAADACGSDISFPAPPKDFICDANDDGKTGKCKSGVAVPIALYKIIYHPELNRVNAYIIPNIDHRGIKDKKDPIDYIQRYRTSVKSVEDLTGLTFFTDMSRRQRNILTNGCGATMRR